MQLERQLRPDAYGRSAAASWPGGGHGPPGRSPRDRRGGTLLVLRRLQWALRHGGGAVHGVDLHPLPGGHQAQPVTRPDRHDPGPNPPMVRSEMRETLELLPSWVLAQTAAANRQVIAVMRQRLAAGEEVARMYQEPGLAWLERQAEAAEQLLAERQAGEQN
jgi:hypothetical protein